MSHKSHSGHEGGHGKAHDLNLAKIVKSLHPDKINKINKAHNIAYQKAVHGYDPEEIEVKGYNELVEKATDFYKNLLGKKLGEKDEDTLRGEVTTLLNALYQKKGGIEYAVSLAKKGDLHEIFRAISSHFKEEEMHNYEEGIFAQIDPSDFDSHVEFVKQYQNAYKNIPGLPDDVVSKKPEELAPAWRALIHQHIQTVGAYEHTATKKKAHGGHDKKTGTHG